MSWPDAPSQYEGRRNLDLSASFLSGGDTDRSFSDTPYGEAWKLTLTPIVFQSAEKPLTGKLTWSL